MNPEAPGNIVGVHVGNPLMASQPHLCPPGNAVAVPLFYRVMELALLRDGLTREDCRGGWGAEFNDCVFVAAVTDPIAAAETIKRELARLALLPHCQIGVPEGAGWRCICPSPDVRMNWLMDRERLEHALAQFLQRQSDQFSVIRAAAERLARKPGQQGAKK